MFSTILVMVIENEGSLGKFVPVLISSNKRAAYDFSGRFD